jgi:16S rRNA (guanine527-N7)-methyltransferase
MDRKDQIDTFCRYNQFSRETIDSLKLFEKILIESNKNLNLIGKSTVKNIWHRHFLDSYQVIDFIDKNDSLGLDLGSGAGFPGIILGLAAKERKMDIKISLLEKSKKKSNFLKKVIAKLNLKMKVINEDLMKRELELKEDVFFARAFKPLPIIFELIHSKAKNWKKILIFQGKSGQHKLLQASKSWDIKYKQRMSVTSSDSKIIEINYLKKK